MKFFARPFVLALVACVPLFLAGCNSSSAPPKEGGDDHGHEHGHDHDHDHAHEGPHGGHVMVIGEEEYHAEWTHDDAGVVTFYILDASMKKDVPVDSESIKLTVNIGDMPKEYILEGDGPMSSKFSIEDKALVGQLEALSDEGVKATLSLDIAGKHFDAPVTAGGHSHDHDHKH